MKSELKNVASFLATAIWADGYYADEEKEQLTQIAEVLDVNPDDLGKAIDEEVGRLESMNDEEVNAYLIDNASVIEPEDVPVLMECAIELVLSDGVLGGEEAEVLFELADATGILSHAAVLLMVADLVKHDPDIEVKFGADE